MKRYLYKFKHEYLKLHENNAYKRPKIEKLGFKPIMEGEEGNLYWAEGWAKSITISHNSSIGDWLKKNVESIYKAEMKKIADKKFDSKWLEEIKKSGYEFDSDGNMIDNEKSKEDIPAQLCVMFTGSLHGTLFINVGNGLEFYESTTLDECAKDEVAALLEAGAIYKKKYVGK